MTGKVTMNLAMSLDGYIADLEGGFNWIRGEGVETDNTANDFEQFLSAVDVVVMGRNCYDQGMANDYPTKKVYVATSENRSDEGNISFVKDIVNRVSMEKANGNQVYLFGGGILVDYFLKAESIDAFIIGIVPIILGKGRPLFLFDNPTQLLHLEKTKVSDGIVILYYTRRQ